MFFFNLINSFTGINGTYDIKAYIWNMWLIFYLFYLLGRDSKVRE